MKPTRYRSESEPKALFERAVCVIGFYELQRKGVLMALDLGPKKSSKKWGESLTFEGWA
jgi:hypothetical protein